MDKDEDTDAIEDLQSYLELMVRNKKDLQDLTKSVCTFPPNKTNIETYLALFHIHSVQANIVLEMEDKKCD